jgi:hypothetical protein
MNPHDLFFRINKLPHELVDVIYDFILGSTKCVLNKKLYQKYHSCIKPYLSSKGLYENYIRDIIRKDFDYVFNEILKENLQYWLKTKKCHYKNLIFPNYLTFLNKFCIEFKSSTCRNIIIEVLSKSGLSKNQHKNNIVKSISREWKN